MAELKGCAEVGLESGREATARARERGTVASARDSKASRLWVLRKGRSTRRGGRGPHSPSLFRPRPINRPRTPHTPNILDKQPSNHQPDTQFRTSIRRSPHIHHRETPLIIEQSGTSVPVVHAERHARDRQHEQGRSGERPGVHAETVKRGGAVGRTESRSLSPSLRSREHTFSSRSRPDDPDCCELSDGGRGMW